MFSCVLLANDLVLEIMGNLGNLRDLYRVFVRNHFLDLLRKVSCCSLDILCVYHCEFNLFRPEGEKNA